MSPIVEHRCQACGTLVAESRRTRPAIGPPFKSCPGCGGIVPRPPYQEWVFLGAVERLTCVGLPAGIAIALGLLPALVYGAVGLALPRGRDPVWLLLVAVAGLVVALAIWSTRLTRDVRRSRRRMADPMYRAKLVEFEIAAQGVRRS